MNIARVIPLRRLPPDRQFFDYFIAADLPIKQGSLVKVPFLKSTVPAVVWKMIDSTPANRLRPLTKLIADQPVITSWQQQAIEIFSTANAATISQILKSVIPLPSQRTVKTAPAVPTSSLNLSPAPPPTGSTWWYRDRRQVLANILFWSRQPADRSKVIVVPTIEDGEMIFALLANAGINAELLHSRTTDSQYRQIYQAVLDHREPVIIGTWRTLLLPFSKPPLVILDQEDHPGYKQFAQYPKIDTSVVAKLLFPDLIITTSAPSLAWFQQQPPTPPPSQPSRQVISMDQPRADVWLTEQLRDQINQTISDHHAVVLITPQRGYASSMFCRDCGQVRTCPKCHNHLRIYRYGHEQLNCRFCGNVWPSSEQCPHCRSWRWQYTGLGVERLSEISSRLWPTAVIANLATKQVTADIYIDTYRAYHELIDLPAVGLVAVVSGDSLLNIPDYSVAERAWQWLARLQSMQPTVPVVVQSFNPTSDFWQRWRRGDDAAWYRHELLVRQQNQLPPYTKQWLAEYRGSNPIASATAAKLTIEKLHLTGLTVTNLPERQTNKTVSASRLLLNFIDPIAADQLDWIQLFPLPWHLDKLPRSWLE